MLLLPVPFLRGFGLGGLLVPALSVLCALTLLPVMLLAFGERLESFRLLSRSQSERRDAFELRLWTRHARWVMRRAKFVAPLVAALLVLAALPLIGIHVGPDSPSSAPPGSRLGARDGSELQAAAGGYSDDPTTIIVAAEARGRSACDRRRGRQARPAPPRRPAGCERLGGRPCRGRPVPADRRRQPASIRRARKAQAFAQRPAQRPDPGRPLPALRRSSSPAAAPPTPPTSSHARSARSPG